MTLHPFLAPEGSLAAPRLAPAPFDSHLELLKFFLARRDAIVERIQGVLNAQRKPAEYLQDAALLSRHFEDCFFTLPDITDSQLRLRGQLEDAHWASGFRPRQIPGLHNGAADPSELMMRAFYLWGQTRWPGRNGRVRYAHMLFNLYVVRCLELLSMRIWDAGSTSAGDRLVQLQSMLDELWRIRTPDQPILVRDARWLIQTAQSLATDDLGAYFEVAQRIDTLPEHDRTHVHNAGVRMTAGHLRSQIRYYASKNGVPFDDAELILNARTTNALDFAMLIQGLVPLLEDYERALADGDSRTRLELADAICQGISPDPEMFLNRIELLGAYSMLEDLFIATDGDGHVSYTSMGQRHVQRIGEYEALIGRASKTLSDDCAQFRPLDGAYSPYGILYGFSADLIKHMALKTSQPDATTRFALEDVFAAGGPDALAWVTGWRKLPHLKREVERLFEYPQQFAVDLFDRLRQALRKRATGDEGHTVVRTGRLFIVPVADRQPDSQASLIPPVPVSYIESSDVQLVAAQKARYRDEARLLSDRREGKYLLSHETSGGWVAITKAVLTEVLGAGRDAKVAGLPAAAAGALTLMYPRLVIVPESA